MDKPIKMESRKATPSDIGKTELWGTWSKEPSIFEYSYDDKETCYIMEGEAEVTDKQGNKISFSAGDWVVFHQGLNCTWNIKKKITKKYFFGEN